MADLTERERELLDIIEQLNDRVKILENSRCLCERNKKDDPDFPPLPPAVQGEEDEEGFIPSNRKRRRRESPAQARKRATIKSQLSGVNKSPKEISQNPGTLNIKSEQPKIPPIYLHNKQQWAAIHTEIKNIPHTATNTSKYIKITVDSLTDYRSISKILKENSYESHSFTLESERMLKVVIKGVPEYFEEHRVHNALCALGFPVLRVNRMRSLRTKGPLPMVQVHLTKNEEGKKIYSQIFTIEGLKVTVESYRRPQTTNQCHNCLQFGHSSTNCNSKAKCFKCAGEHDYKNCPKPKEQPGKCVNCGEAHIAIFRGCNEYKKFAATRRRQHLPPQQKAVHTTHQSYHERTDPNISYARMTNRHTKTNQIESNPLNELHKKILLAPTTMKKMEVLLEGLPLLFKMF